MTVYLQGIVRSVLSGKRKKCMVSKNDSEPLESEIMFLFANTKLCCYAESSLSAWETVCGTDKHSWLVITDSNSVHRKTYALVLSFIVKCRKNVSVI